MKTAPISEAALMRYDEFAEAVRKRLEAGCRTYGDESFNRPLHEVVQELQQECMDLAGWGFILFRRLAEIERLARAAANTERMVRMAAHDWTVEDAYQQAGGNGKAAA